VNIGGGMIQFDTQVRGTNVTVAASKFFSDHSVGMELGPEEVVCIADGGDEIELTDEEFERLGIEATRIYVETSDDD